MQASQNNKNHAELKKKQNLNGYNKKVWLQKYGPMMIEHV